MEHELATIDGGANVDDGVEKDGDNNNNEVSSTSVGTAPTVASTSSSSPSPSSPSSTTIPSMSTMESAEREKKWQKKKEMAMDQDSKTRKKKTRGKDPPQTLPETYPGDSSSQRTGKGQSTQETSVGMLPTGTDAPGSKRNKNDKNRRKTRSKDKKEQQQPPNDDVVPTTVAKDADGVATRRERIARDLHSDSSGEDDGDDHSDDDDHDNDGRVVTHQRDIHDVPGAHTIYPAFHRGSGNLNEYDDIMTVVTRDVDDSSESLLQSSTGGLTSQPGLASTAVAVAINEEDLEEQEPDDEQDGVLEAEVIDEEEVEKKSIGRWVRRHKRLAVILAVTFVTILVVMISLVATGTIGGDDPLDGTSERFREALVIVEEVTPQDIILDRSTPQYEALTWLADEDQVVQDWNLTAANANLVRQRYIVLVLYFSTSGQYWRDDFKELPECEWNGTQSDPSESDVEIGVTCDNDGFLIDLSLRDANLSGTIPAELGSLSFMETVLLANNSALRGQIPDAMFSVQDLSKIHIFACGLTGSIPDAIGNATALIDIDFSTNNIEGTIPSSLGQLSLLTTFKAGANKLNGTIPSELGNLSSARTITLQDNLLEGSIPSELGRLSGLSELNLSYNSLTDGAENLCDLASETGPLQAYTTDCYSAIAPPTPKELECCCCSQCCSQEENCLFNENNCEA